MPALRRRRKPANGRVSGSAASAGGRDVHGLLERRAQVRRPERDDMAHPVHPRVAALDGLVTRAASDEAAHRVPDQRDAIHLDRPRRHQRLQQVRQRAPVLRDVEAGVVAELDRRDPDVAPQPRPVRLVAAVAPGVLALHQAVEEDHHVWRRLRERGRHRGGLRGHRVPAMAHGHRHAQRRALALEPVADQPVERRQRQGAAGMARQSRRLAPADQLGGRAAEQRARTAQARVDAGGDAVVHDTDRQPLRADGAEDTPGDAEVHAADAGHCGAELLEAQASEGSQLIRLADCPSHPGARYHPSRPVDHGPRGALTNTSRLPVATTTCVRTPAWDSSPGSTSSSVMKARRARPRAALGRPRRRRCPDWPARRR